MGDDLNFDEQVELRKQIPHEGLALMSALLDRSAAHDFATMSSLYESEKKLREAAEEEARSLRADAFRWKYFCAMIQDTIDPQEWP